LIALALLPTLGGCVTVAEHRKLESEVNRLKGQSASGGDRARVADLGADLQALREEIAQLEGRIEVVEHQSASALEEARAARQQSYSGAAPGAAGGDPPPEVPGDESASAELRAYREAYAAWRADEHQACIDRFREFLQTYSSSEYADDASFWMADCYFKQGDYKTAILRFDDVAGRYPQSEKAPDALYRQGEALLRLGPNYGRAAEKAFRRVVEQYPDSPRAAQAKNQLELLGTG
jgi:tol-pal system protein YbgF